jgi:hypothetical protein
MDELKVARETERITVALVPAAIEARTRLRELTRLSQTDIVNRALQLYDFIEDHIRAGDDIVLRHPDGTAELIRLL